MITCQHHRQLNIQHSRTDCQTADRKLKEQHKLNQSLAGEAVGAEISGEDALKQVSTTQWNMNTAKQVIFPKHAFST